MLPSRSGILAVAISIASTSLQQRQLFPSLRFYNVRISEAVVRSCSVEKVFLKISQNLQVFPLAQVYPVNFVKF